MKLFILIGLAAVLCSGCQTGSGVGEKPGASEGKADAATQSMSLEEAKSLSTEFKRSAFVPPARTLDAFRKFVGFPTDNPMHCDDIRQIRAQKAEQYKKLVGNFKDKSVFRFIAVRAEEDFDSGNIHRSLDLLKSTAPRVPLSGRKAVLYFQLARFYAAIGDRANMEAALRSATAHSDGFNFFSGIEEHVKLFKFRADIATTKFEGKLVKAEELLREAKWFAHNRRYTGEFTSFPYKIQTDLSELLLLQGRIVEAELEAREGLIDAYRSAQHSFPGYSFVMGGLATQLSKALFEQGRVDDAAYTARLAIKIYRLNCAEEESLQLLRARQALLKILLQKSDKEGLRALLKEIMAAIEKRPKLFDVIFAEDIDFAHAMIVAGDAAQGLDIIGKVLNAPETVSERNSLRTAVARGIAATALAASGDLEAAARGFARVLPELIAGRERLIAGQGAEVSNGRINRIINSYLHLLVRLQQEAANGDKLRARELAEQAFEVATVAQSSAVRRSLSVVAARLQTQDAELSGLIRREQDISEHLSVLRQAMFRAKYAPTKIEDWRLVHQLSAEIQKLSEAKEKINAAVRQRFPEFSGWTSIRMATVAQIQGALRADEAMIFIHSTESKTLVWAVPKTGDIGFNIVPIGSKALAEDVEWIRQSLNPNADTLAGIPRFDVEAASRLYKRLLAPLEKSWKSARSLIAVTQGPIGVLPLSLLPTASVSLPDDSALLFSEYRNVPWLARTHAVSYLPSVASLMAIRAVATAKLGHKPFVGFGDPVFESSEETAEKAGARRSIGVKARPLTKRSGGSARIALRSAPSTRSLANARLDNLNPLPGTADEIRRIAAILNADVSNDVHLREAASESNVYALSRSGRLADYSILSFATHGLVPGDINGLTEPALALSNPEVIGGDNDGLLTMSEVFGLKLKADWVILSACNTAAADGEGMEAVSGLGRAFFHAGTRSLLVSNWPVHSRATIDLMTSLFLGVRNDKTLSKADAHRKAMLQMIDKGVYRTNAVPAFSYAHPIFWAPFTLIGESGSRLRNVSG